MIGLLAFTLTWPLGSVDLAVPNPEDGTSPGPDPNAPAPVTAASRIVPGSFWSQAMRSERTFDIYLPPSYDQAPDTQYPVLYLLHGDDGRIDGWPAMGLRMKLDRAIAAGEPEMIVVMPDGSGHYNDLTDWANRWDGTDRVEDQVLELVTIVDQSYRTISDRSTRYIGGLSSGGFGALNIALHHPDLFSTAMSFSGFIAADDREADAGVFGADPTYIKGNSPAALVTSNPGAGDIYYVLSGGETDPYFRERMAEFSSELGSLGIAHEFHVVPGGHDAMAWMAGLDFGLAYLAGQMSLGNGPGSRRHSE